MKGILLEKKRGIGLNVWRYLSPRPGSMYPLSEGLARDPPFNVFFDHIIIVLIPSKIE